MSEETRYLKRLKKIIGDKECKLSEIAEFMNEDENFVSSELKILESKGYIYERNTEYRPFHEGSKVVFKGVSPVYKLTIQGSDAITFRRDEWIKFWIPVILSAMAIAISYAAFQVSVAAIK